MEAHHTRLPAGDVAAAFDVVVLVASAGGLEAVTRILSDLPREFPAAVVVMQHLAGHGSALEGILRRRTKLPVHWIHEGAALEPGRVHVKIGRAHV